MSAAVAYSGGSAGKGWRDFARPGSSTTSHSPGPISSTHKVVRNVLYANGIGNVRFGASPADVRAAVDPLLEQPGGWVLATARGLRVGDTLARGRSLYGRAFTTSTAQGGSWAGTRPRRADQGLRLGGTRARRADPRRDDRLRRCRLPGSLSVSPSAARC